MTNNPYNQNQANDQYQPLVSNVDDAPYAPVRPNNSGGANPSFPTANVPEAQPAENAYQNYPAGYNPPAPQPQYAQQPTAQPQQQPVQYNQPAPQGYNQQPAYEQPQYNQQPIQYTPNPPPTQYAQPAPQPVQYNQGYPRQPAHHNPAGRPPPIHGRNIHGGRGRLIRPRQARMFITLGVFIVFVAIVLAVWT